MNARDRAGQTVLDSLDPEQQTWTDDQARGLARTYSVSGEMILRRLLILRRTTERFYRLKRQQFLEEQRAREERELSGFAPAHAVALNRIGRVFARAVLEGFHEGRVSPSDGGSPIAGQKSASNQHA